MASIKHKNNQIKTILLNKLSDLDDEELSKIA